MPKNLNDIDLLAKLMLGDKSAFEILFNRHWSKIYDFAFNFTGDYHIADEVVQEVFVGLWSNRAKTITNIESYLFQAVRYQVFQTYKRSKAVQKKMNEAYEYYKRISLEQPSDLKQMVSVDPEMNPYLTKLNRCLEQLPARKREIFKLHKFQHLSHKEIAERLGISVQTVKNQISSTFKLLREKLPLIIVWLNIY